MRQPLRYRTDGPDGAPVIMLGPARRTNLHLWDAVAAQLTGQWRVLRHDLPTQHEAAEAADGVLAILDRHAVRRAVYCGVSSSAAVGQHLAVHRPHRLHSLVLLCDTTRFGDATAWTQDAKWLREFFGGYDVPVFPGRVGVRTAVLAGTDRSAGPPALLGELAPGVPAGLLRAVAPPWHPTRLRYPLHLAGLLHQQMLEL